MLGITDRASRITHPATLIIARPEFQAVVQLASISRRGQDDIDESIAIRHDGGRPQFLP